MKIDDKNDLVISKNRLSHKISEYVLEECKRLHEQYPEHGIERCILDVCYFTLSCFIANMAHNGFADLDSLLDHTNKSVRSCTEQALDYLNKEKVH